MYTEIGFRVVRFRPYDVIVHLTCARNRSGIDAYASKSGVLNDSAINYHRHTNDDTRTYKHAHVNVPKPINYAEPDLKYDTRPVARSVFVIERHARARSRGVYAVSKMSRVW